MLYVTEDRFPPYRADVVELFARQLPQRGLEIEWLMQPQAGHTRDAKQIRWHGHRVYLKAVSRLPGRLAKIADRLLDLVGDFKIITLSLRNRYDVIQVRDRCYAGLLALLAARLARARFCYWMSYPFAEEDLYLARAGLVQNRIRYYLRGCVRSFLLYRILLRRADHVFVQSEQMLHDVARQGIGAEKLTPVLMAISAARVRRAHNATPPNRDTPVLLYLGTLFRVRHLDFLVRVLAKVVTRYPGATLKLVGEGYVAADRAAIETEARCFGLSEKIIFTGFLPMETAWRHVEAADICLSPFYPIPVLLSTSPTKLIEYLALGKVAVASDHPEQSRVIRESGAGVCAPWDETAFAGAICALLDDPHHAQALAAKGPEYVRRFRTYEVVAAQVDAVYKRLVC